MSRQPLPDLLPSGLPSPAAAFSNLTLSFFAVPAGVRRHLRIFYAFCKTIDDVADSPSLTADEKHRRLELWREALLHPELLPRDLKEVFDTHRIENDLPLEILDGVRSDVSSRRFEDFASLANYCGKVAIAVGLVANKITGAFSEQAAEYARSLGMALQLTNILRDVAEDLQMGRVYLPQSELRSFGVSEAALSLGVETREIRALFAFQASRAREFFQRVRLPDSPAEVRALRAAEIMRNVYSCLLAKMEKDNFRVLSVRYRLGALEKMKCFLMSQKMMS